MSNRPRVLLIDDEAPLRESLGFLLNREGFDVTTSADGTAGLEMARQHMPDIVVLDVSLPGIDGYEVCRRLRAVSDVPVVMLTARDQGNDRVTGFERGADDYVTKPFISRELVARVRAVLRRSRQARELLEEDRALLSRIEEATAHAPPPRGGTPTGDLVVAGPITLHPSRLEVIAHGRTQTLTAAECRLLECLMLHRGRVVTRTELIEVVWGDPAEGRTLLEAHIRMLRAKVEPEPARPTLIVAVPGIGYQLA